MKKPFADLFDDATAGISHLDTSGYKAQGKMAIVDQGKDQVAGYTDDPDVKPFNKVPCLIFGDHTKIVKFVETPFVLGAQGVRVLTPKKELDPKYAYFMLRNFAFPENTGYQRHFKYLGRAKFEVPSPSSQLRIAATLSQVETLHQKHTEAQRLVGELVPSIFFELFGTGFTQASNGTALDDLVDVCGGKTPSTTNPSYWGKGHFWVSSKDFISETMEVTQDQITKRAVEDGQATMVPSNSILLVARSGILKRTVPMALAGLSMAINQDIKAFLPKPDAGIDSNFLIWLLRSNTQRLLTLVKRGATVESLDIDKLLGFKVKLPTGDQLRRFNRVLNLAGSLKQKLEIRGQEIEKLQVSTRKSAFG
jgi:type I restriction enzyme S subunit